MIKKGTKVKWFQDRTTLFGIVIETYAYKFTKKLKKNSFLGDKTANMALYIRRSDGLHVLKNDTDVYRLD